MQEKGSGKKRPISAKTLKYLRFALIGILTVALVLFLRTLYVVAFNPMAAFNTPKASATVAPSVSPEPTQTPVLTPSASPTPTPSPTPEPLPPEEAFEANGVNILLVGFDRSPEREDPENEVYRDERNDYRSDVLMLLSVDFSQNKAHLISVPRDTYAPIFNDKGEQQKGSYKINAAFSRGGSGTEKGYKYAMETVGRLLGVNIEYYAGVDMSGLKGVVNVMGGVYYDVDVAITLNGRQLKKGYQKLNGQQVLDYCRARKGISLDTGRNDRQQRILIAIFEQLKSRDQLKNFTKVYRVMRPHIDTNLKTEQVAAIALFGMQLNKEDILRHTLSGEYNSKTPYSRAVYYLLDNEALSDLSKRIFRITHAPNPRYDINYVLADIEAAAGRDDLKACEYLLKHQAVRLYYGAEEGGVFLSPTQTLLALNESMGGLSAVSMRHEGDDLDIPFNVGAILQKRSELYASMRQLCLEVGLTQKDVTKGKLPKEVYEWLAPQTETEQP
ncbi:MAG TPA: LCP family protein [Clostridia bacterium]|nr:LCP family protein [Clostridia bacterium]